MEGMVPTNRRDGVSGRHGAYKWEGYCLSGRNGAEKWDG